MNYVVIDFYVLKKSEVFLQWFDFYEGCYYVGFYMPDGKIFVEEHFQEDSLDDARALCSYLNGGAKPNGY